MKNITNTTICCIDTKNIIEALVAIDKSIEQTRFDSYKLFTTNINDIDLSRFKNLPNVKLEVINIPVITNKFEYSKFCLVDLNKYIDTEFCLVIQHDGFIINPDMWSDKFMEYDYIGAPWPDNFVNRVGNGGFSLRSKKFLQTCLDIFGNEDILEHEDLLACVYRYNEFSNRGVKFAPVDLAIEFSIEHIVPELKSMKSFGFHGTFTELGRRAINENLNNISL